MPYRTMDAGEDLDHFIAENILGWKKERVVTLRGNIDHRWWNALGHFQGWQVPKFTTDLSATGLLIDMVLDHDADLRMSIKRNGCKCSIMAANGHIFIGEAATRPLALCRAIMQFYLVGLNQRKARGLLPRHVEDPHVAITRYYDIA